MYLGTVQKYMLQEDGNLLITISDTTKVKNPNE